MKSIFMIAAVSLLLPSLFYVTAVPLESDAEFVTNSEAALNENFIKLTAAQQHNEQTTQPPQTKSHCAEIAVEWSKAPLRATRSLKQVTQKEGITLSQLHDTVQGMLMMSCLQNPSAMLETVEKYKRYHLSFQRVVSWIVGHQSVQQAAAVNSADSEDNADGTQESEEKTQEAAVNAVQAFEPPSFWTKIQRMLGLGAEKRAKVAEDNLQAFPDANAEEVKQSKDKFLVSLNDWVQAGRKLAEEHKNRMALLAKQIEMTKQRAEMYNYYLKTQKKAASMYKFMKLG